jgi:hypothetical protein
MNRCLAGLTETLYASRPKAGVAAGRGQKETVHQVLCIELHVGTAPTDVGTAASECRLRKHAA